MAKPIQKPRDWSQRALSIVQQATGQMPKQAPPHKDAEAVARGQMGGLRGGKARSAKLSAERRSAIARKAARARWQSSK